MKRFFVQGGVRKGFTVLDSMLASFVLIAGSAVGLTILMPALDQTQLARDKFVATALAQEGLELVRNIRDNNRLNDLAFDQGISGGTYCIDHNDSAAGSCVGDGDIYIANGWYGHDVGTETAYKRQVFTERVGADLVVTSYALWGEGSYPVDRSDESDCTITNECVFIRTVFAQW